MEKDFTIEVDVRLFANWRFPANREEKEAVDDRHGMIACDLDEAVRMFVEGQIEINRRLI